MATAFSALLTRLIAERFGQQKLFAKSAGIGVTRLGHYCTGRNPPPLELLDLFADLLQLDVEDRRAFLEAGWLAASPGQVRDLVESLRADLARERARVDDLVVRLSSRRSPRSN